MKRLFLAIPILFVASMGYCLSPVVRSSFTQTQDFERTLCGQRVIGASTTTIRGVLYSIVVSSAGGAGSAISVCNSSFTTVGGDLGGCANVDTRTFEGRIEYNTIFPKGMIYSSTGTATKAIMYDCL